MTAIEPVIVVGAGIAGLTAACELARRGCRVMLFDAGEPGQGTTTAAAAYLQDTPGGLAISPLSRAALDIWPGWIQQLERETGLRTDFQNRGALRVGRRRDLTQLDLALEYGGPAMRRLTPDAARLLEPGLSGDFEAAIFDPSTAWVNPTRLVACLVEALGKGGVDIHTHRPVQEVLILENKISGIRTDDGEVFPARRVVIAGGLATGFKAGRLRGPGWLHPATRPVKGEMLALQADPDALPIRHLILRPDGGILPRTDGRIIIGATTKQNIADMEVSIADTDALLADAIRYVPALADLPVVDRWAGLRPYGADGLPLIGEATVRGLYLINGLGAHGIKLAPVTALAIADLITSGTTSLPIERFIPQR